MIDFYCNPSPNSFKVALMLEETGVAHRKIVVDTKRGEQFAPALLEVNPSNKVPAIIDHNGPKGPMTMFESGAILLYLAEKSGRFLSVDLRKRYTALQWLFWQVTGIGTTAGQALHFREHAAQKNLAASEHFSRETERLLGVMNKQLEQRDWLADDYSIADMACWGWVQMHDRYSINLADYPHVRHWLDLINVRPAAARARALGGGTLPIEPEPLS